MHETRQAESTATASSIASEWTGTLVGHSGAMVGHLAGMETDPDAGFGVIVLQNGFGARPMTLAGAVRRDRG